MLKNIWFYEFSKSLWLRWEKGEANRFSSSYFMLREQMWVQYWCAEFKDVIDFFVCLLGGCKKKRVIIAPEKSVRKFCIQNQELVLSKFSYYDIQIASEWLRTYMHALMPLSSHHIVVSDSSVAFLWVLLSQSNLLISYCLLSCTGVAGTQGRSTDVSAALMTFPETRRTLRHQLPSSLSLCPALWTSSVELGGS